MRIGWPDHGLWRHPNFLRLWGAQAVSTLGSRFTRTVLPLLAIFTLEATPEQVALLAALSSAPGVLVGLFFGGTVDRQPKRRLLVGADVVRAALLFTVPVAAWSGLVSMGQLYVVAFLVGGASALFAITDNSYLPALIPKERLVEGNSKLNATESFSEITGPGLAGVVMQVVSAPFAIVLDAVSYLVSAALLLRIDVREERTEAADEQAPSRWEDLKTGLRAGFGTPLLRSVHLAHANAAFFGGFFFALYSLFGVRVIGLSPAGLGTIVSVGGVGALVGAWAASRLEGRLPLGPAMIGGLALAELSSLLMPLAAWAPSLTWAVVLMVGHQLISDGLQVYYDVLATSLRQTALPGEVLGRANATLHVVLSGLMPLGALVAGPLASATSIELAVLVGVLGGLVNPLLLLASPSLRHLRRISDAA